MFDSAVGNELRLEGIEKSDDGRFWKVTLSYDSGKSNLGLLSLSRDYKTVKLRDDTGELIGAQNGVLLGQM